MVTRRSISRIHHEPAMTPRHSVALFLGITLSACRQSGNESPEIQATFLPASNNLAVMRYFDERLSESGKGRSEESLPGDLRLKGSIACYDVVPEHGISVIQTFEGSSWKDQQHFYYRRQTNGRIVELSLSEDALYNPKLIQCKENWCLVMSGHRETDQPQTPRTASLRSAR